MTDRSSPAGVPLGLFEGVGIELEYMIVDSRNLEVRPVADRLLATESGEVCNELERGDIGWSNELAAHVIELKTNGPVARAWDAAADFQDNVAHANAVLAAEDCMLLPSAMHPWMNPASDLVLWEHEDATIYEAFDRVFGCSGHGWANLQSMHVNLPFRGDDELARLHAAIRLVLPILPALAASSPIVDGRPSGFLDARMEYYRTNARRVPSVSGLVVPEPIRSRADYERVILERIYADLAPWDPEGTLRHEWVNSRGVIARFDRSALEIRVLDVQEHPAADLAIASAVVAVVRWLVEGGAAPLEDQVTFDTAPLAIAMLETIRQGDRAAIHDPRYLRLLGFERGDGCTAGELWQDLVDRIVSRDPGFAAWRGPLEVILEQGCLARRILAHLAGELDRPGVARAYRDLAACLAEGRSLRSYAN